MVLFEKILIGIRHSNIGKRFPKLWDFVRPHYDKAVQFFGKRGLKRTLNQTDEILVPPRLRCVSEVYEPNTWTELMSTLKEGDVFVDIGANIGLYTLAVAKRIGKHGFVHAFEPDPINYTNLCENVVLNRLQQKVKVYQVVVGDKNCEICFSAQGNSESSVCGTGGENLVQQVKLDSMLPDKFDILKIDVEGYEENVLKGAQEILSNPQRRPRKIFVEVHSFAWLNFGTTWDFLLEMISGGYLYRVIDGKPNSATTHIREIVCDEI